MESVPTKKQILGSLGEAIASKYLVNKGFTVVEMNYRKKFGEIDIIVKKGQKIHFVEVKTVSKENVKDFNLEAGDSFRPEDNVHAWKLQRLSRTITVYLAENKYGDETEWQFDVITIYLDEKNKTAKVKMLDGVIL
ncbi:MAG: YraN family protein [Patescibacteria group bacterium]